MRVLRFHASYTEEGGEDHSVRAEIELLESYGIEVSSFFTSNADVLETGMLGTAATLWQSAWSREIYERTRALCRDKRPDIAHADNLWFTLSPSIHAACHAEGVPTVQALRNYRLVCLNAGLQRHGRPCEKCLGRNPWPGIVHRCYRSSAVLSAAVAQMIVINRRRLTWERDVDLFLTPTRFARDKLISGGLPADRIVVKPDFMRDPGPVSPPPGGSGGVYVGRLAAEKGVATLLEAWRNAGGERLTIVGEGPQRAAFESQAAQLAAADVRFTGWLDPDRCRDAMSRAAFLVFPSENYETFGRTVMEAFAVGRAVIAAEPGAAAELVTDGENGLLYPAGDVAALNNRIRRLVADPRLCRTLGAGARASYEASFTPERNFEPLIEIYRRAAEIFGRSRTS